MSYRIHTADARYLTVNYVENPEEYFDDEEMAVGPSLVLNDSGNLEAFVIPAPREDIASLAKYILAAIEPPKESN